MNFVFCGEFYYPEGMAGTQRVSRILEVLRFKNIPVAILLPTIKHISCDLKLLSNDVFYTQSRAGRLVFLDPIYWIGIFGTLRKNRSSESINYLYLYDGINLVTLPFVLCAFLLRYNVLVDVVEDYSLQDENESVAFWFKRQSRKLCELVIWLKNVQLIVISKQLQKKYLLKRKPSIHLPIMALDNKSGGIIEEYFAYAGGFGKKDGVDILVRAFQLARVEIEGLRLMITGEREKFVSGYNSLDLTNIHFVGRLSDSDLQIFLQKSMCLIMPRRASAYGNAGFPFKLGEYLATARPVISSRSSNVEEYLKDGESALLYESEDVNELAQKIKSVYNMGVRRDEIGRNGHKVWSDFFTPKSNVENLLQSLSLNRYG